MERLICVFLCLVASCRAVSLGSSAEDSKCGYQSCPKIKKGMLNVHLVAHTHDDVGWLKTYDQYYYGSKSDTAKAGVQYIIDSVVDELLKDPARRFIYVETAFFWKWWMEQHDARRHQVKRLVNNGQLEIIGGAWSMNDEADTHYQSTIDQFTWGFRKMEDAFGVCGRPKIGWQIDPFGHSRELASIMARLGFDGLFLGRMDYQDKDHRLMNKLGEMIWQGSPDNLGSKADIFTGVLFNNYSPPPNFCFDLMCDDEPIIDNKKSPEYNAEKKVKQFLHFAELASLSYKSQNVIITMGGDFNYQDAGVWFKNMDKLMRVANSIQVNGTQVNLLYSTPSCYLKAVNEENLNYTTKQDDFFPYASDPHSYWTGYFTSRPTIKFYERRGNNFLQICKQLYALTDLGPEDKVELDSLRSAMGVMQHHDAITGTEKQVVAFDYARILNEGIEKCESVTDAALRKLMSKKQAEYMSHSDDLLTINTCPLLNISQCETSENFDTFVVTLYNPLSRNVTKYVRLPIPEGNVKYSVLCPMGHDHIVQIVPLPEAVQNIPGRFSQAKYELVFKAFHLPPLGFRSYYVKKHSTSESRSDLSRESSKNRTKYTIGNPKYISYTMSAYDDWSKVISNRDEFKLVQRFYYYKGAVGNNEEFKNRSSGAYIFRPNGTDPILIGKDIKVKKYKGPLVEELHITFSSWVSQIVRIYKEESNVEYNWLVGPIPIDDDVGKEVISRFSTNLKTDKVFFTDSNGREVLQRVRNYRPTWNLSNHEPISGNYYPITSKISIKDDKQQFSVLTDRAQGGSSINDGEVELMVHRRLLHDDAFGVSEALNETAFGVGLVARGTHYVTLGSLDKQNAVERALAQEKILDSWMFLSPAPQTTFEQWNKTYNMLFSGLKNSLPKNIQILTLEPWKGRSFLIRLEHVFEKGEDKDLSKPVSVSIKDIFSPFTITSLKETTLGANVPIKEMRRLKWHRDSNAIPQKSGEENEEDFLQGSANDFKITLNPMEIRTFIVEVKFNSDNAF